MKTCGRFLRGAVWGLVMLALASGAQARDKEEGWEKSDIPERDVDVTFVAGRNTKESGTDYDNRKQTLDSKLIIKNKDNHDELTDLQATVLIVGESVEEHDVLIVLKNYSTQGTVPPRETKDFDLPVIHLEYDDNNTAKFGFKYEGYLVVILDSEDKLVLLKSNKSTLRKHAKELLKFEEGTTFDKKGNKLRNRYYFRSY